MRVSSPLSPGLIRRVGVPSFPDWGIGRAYNESDQRVWMVKCHACNEQQTLDFFRNINMKTAERVCHKCDAVIDGDIVNGQWVATYPDRDVRGYHISRLIAPTADMKVVIKQSKKRLPHEQTVFYNKHLGVPFATEEGRLSKEAIAAAQQAGGEYVMNGAVLQTGEHLRTMGIDDASGSASTFPTRRRRRCSSARFPASTNSTSSSRSTGRT
jgi:phage terminase large subunit GpA-like protein